MTATQLQLPIPLDELRQILHSYGVIEASVFGSYARGEAQSSSDLDLLVTYGPMTNLFKIIDLQDELQSATGRHVDLVSSKYIRPGLAARINDDLVRLY